MKQIAKELQAFQDHLLLRNFSVATQRAYGSGLRKFLEWREQQGVSGPLTQDDARQYLLERYKAGKRWQTINGDYSAMRKYYREVLGLDWSMKKLRRPRKERVLPRIVSKRDVHRMITHSASLKDQAFVCLLYGTGLRVGEAVGLKLSDINGDRSQLLVRKGKGSKDRYVDLPACLLDLLRQYYREYRPKEYLFNGKHGEPLAVRSAQHLIYRSCDRAGLGKKVSPHILRHCYATHHLESGSDLVYLQQQLGHKHLKTTARYIHLLKEHSWRIQHPLASMQIAYRSRIQ